MILHRFCSKKEFEAYQRGELLVNVTDHSVKRGSASTSVGFCFFKEDPEEAKHWLSGIVDFDVCITVELKSTDVFKSKGRYLSPDRRFPIYRREYCTTSYDNSRFKLISYNSKYSGYAPNHSFIKQLYPEIFV